MGAIRVLIVDDSVVVRRLVSDVITSTPELEVAAIAANGRIALARIPQVNPDVVILDVEMPELGGLETLVKLRSAYPRLPVIMFSSLTERGAATTLDALTRGASDYVTKPSSVGGMQAALDQVRAQLVPKILALSGRSAAAVRAAPAPALDRQAPAKASVIPAQSYSWQPSTGLTPSPIEIVAIGASTGGPNALAVVLSALPADFPVPIVITQHMPEMFTRLLAERLDAKCALTVREVEVGAVLKPGSVWVARGDHHLVLATDGRTVSLATNRDPPENACRPAVDVMLRSVAQIYGAGALSVILTGMGQDGLRGSESVRERGGTVFAQDEDSSVVWGMPGFVVRQGLADQVLPLSGVAAAIVTTAARSRRKTPVVGPRERHHAD